MEATSGAAICLICFKRIEKHMFVPSDAPAKIFGSCNSYLHSTITKDALIDIQLNNENELPLCKSCFDSALQLTQMSEQLTIVQKDISDLSVTFSMEVFHRRSQVYNFNQTQNISQSSSNSAVIEFNESCLPPNLFSTKNEHENIHHNDNDDQYIILDSLHSETDITNVKLESIDLQFDNLLENGDKLIENDDTEKQFNQENYAEKHLTRHAMERNRSASINKMRIGNVASGNDSRNCKDLNNRNQRTDSDLLKSVKMPKIRLEKIKTDCHLVGATVMNSFQTNGDPGKNIIGETMLQDDVFSGPYYGPTRSSSGGEKRLKCFYCETTFEHKNSRDIHLRTHTGEKRFQCMVCQKRFTSSSTLNRHGKIHTGEKPYQCSLCDEKFTQSNTLKDHIRTHTGEKPFQCSLCYARFAHSSTLRNHGRTHTGEKPFQCLLCDARFTHVKSLKNHKRIHTTEMHFQL